MIEHELDRKDKQTVAMILDEVKKRDIFSDQQFGDRVRSAVGRLHDEGVEIGEFLGSTRRIVFKGKYLGRDVAIKFSHSKGGINQDEKQQRREEKIWLDAVRSGDKEYFAQIFFGDINSDYVVQEFCRDVNSWEYDQLPRPYQLMVGKYGMREVEVGYKDGKMKFVDYGY